MRKPTPAKIVAYFAAPRIRNKINASQLHFRPPQLEPKWERSDCGIWVLGICAQLYFSAHFMPHCHFYLFIFICLWLPLPLPLPLLCALYSFIYKLLLQNTQTPPSSSKHCYCRLNFRDFVGACAFHLKTFAISNFRQHCLLKNVWVNEFLPATNCWQNKLAKCFKICMIQKKQC